MAMTSAIRRQISKEIEDAAQEIGKRHGVSIKAGGIRYSDDNFTLKMEIAELAADGSVRDYKAEQRANDFRAHAELFGLKPEMLGTVIDWMGKKIKITGLNINAPKNSIVGELNGQQVSFSPRLVQTALGIK